MPFSSVSSSSLTGVPFGEDNGVFRTSSRFISTPQATSARPAGRRTPLFVCTLRRVVLPSKPLRCSPRCSVTPSARKRAASHAEVSASR